MAAKNNIINYGLSRDFIERIAGKEAINVIKVCNKRRCKVTDEYIEKRTSLKITEIRTILNRLHYRGIACYQKTRNNKTGWYSYTWDIKPKRIAELVIEEQAEEIKKLEKKLEMESQYMFLSCPSNCNSLQFEIAAEYNFKCPKCGTSLKSVDSKKRTNRIKRQIKNINEEMAALQKFL